MNAFSMPAKLDVSPGKRKRAPPPKAKRAEMRRALANGTLDTPPPRHDVAGLLPGGGSLQPLQIKPGQRQA